MNREKDKTFDISRLEHEGHPYSGWIIPSKKRNAEGEPSSYHVVLDNVFFGNLSFENGRWSIDDQRPGDLVQAVGQYIEKHVRPLLHLQ